LSVGSYCSVQNILRDKWLCLRIRSIWNMPIGSGAVYTPANIQPAHFAGADLEYFYKLKASDPLRPVTVLVTLDLDAVQVSNL